MTLYPDGDAGIHQWRAGADAPLHRRRRGPLPTGAGRRAWKGEVVCPWEACHLPEAYHPLEACRLLEA